MPLGADGGHYAASFNGFARSIRLCLVRNLSAGQFDGGGKAGDVGRDVDLGREAASRAPETRPRSCCRDPLFTGAGSMLVRSRDRAVDHLDSVRHLTAARQRFQHSVPNPCQRPASELAVNAAPVAEMVVKVAPGRCGSSDPEHAVQRASVVRRRTTALAPAGHYEGRKEVPLLIRHQAPNHCRLQTATLNQMSAGMGLHVVNRNQISSSGRASGAGRLLAPVAESRVTRAGARCCGGAANVRSGARLPKGK